LAVVLASSLAALWASLDVTRLATALPAFKAGVAAVVIRHAQASAALAAQQYQRQRVAAGVGGSFRPSAAPPPKVAQIAQSVDWAVQPLWNYNVQTAAHENQQRLREALAATGTPTADYLDALLQIEPAQEAPSAGSAIADAKARLAASSERLVLDTGRNTVIDSAQRDPKAKGWARIPEPGACSFCLMLATRGAVYRSESTADFKSHDNCRCHVEPVFTAYEPSAAVRQAQALWASSTRGKSGNAARIAFRQAVEGRTAPTK